MRELSVAIPGVLDSELRNHLIREVGQEDLCFALWYPSQGERRYTGLINAVLLPEDGDRQVHGNVSFNQQFLERACRAACAAGMGVAFLHSHPAEGWQGMSPDDIVAEKQMMDAVEVLTGFPLLGLTCGTDGYWSARFWGEAFDATRISWCASVRVLGEMLNTYFNDRLVPPPRYQEMFKRTETVWGPKNHANLARLRIGIVGLGSVGSLVAETLARMGMTCFCLIDFDEVQAHNLDRLLGATKADIGRLKIDVAARQMMSSATAEKIEIRCVPFSVAEEAGYRAALDCDVIFSCVDRPRARAILNHLAYAHLIPVIDGGIQVRFKKGVFSGADWQLQTVGPGRPCLECLGTFTQSDVETEKAGMLEDPKYMDKLPADHRFKNNENVFPFSSNLASLEVFQLIALATGAARITDFGVQRFRYMPGHLESDTGRKCQSSCFCNYLTARGDKDFCLTGTDLGAIKARERQARRVAAPGQSTQGGMSSLLSIAQKLYGRFLRLFGRG